MYKLKRDNSKESDEASLKNQKQVATLRNNGCVYADIKSVEM